jgi:adenosylcobinamide-phosphate synthase
MGRFLKLFGDWLTTLPPQGALVGGTALWWLGACVVAIMALALDIALSMWTMSEGTLWAVAVQSVALGLLLKPMLSWRMLRDEVAEVELALSRSLPQGSQRLRRLVSRDVAGLDDAAVRESAIESLAENFNDAVVAPLFWFAVGGLPAAAVYRFANTADAMWGYRGRYEWAGKWAARADDALSWVPARLSALLLCLAAMRSPPWAALRAQARLTPSPNGGWPMGAMALLLGRRLGKPGVYALNEQAPPPEPSDTARALAWTGTAVSWCGALSVLSMAALAGAW